MTEGEGVVPEGGASLLAQGPIHCEEVQQVHVALHTGHSQGPGGACYCLDCTVSSRHASYWLSPLQHRVVEGQQLELVVKIAVDHTKSVGTRPAAALTVSHVLLQNMCNADLAAAMDNKQVT